MSLWEQPKRLETASTRFGEFVRQEGQDTWQFFIDFGDTPIYVSAGDANGEPNPEFLKTLSFIRENWHSLENAARQTVPKLSEKHLFRLIKDLGN